MNGLTKVLNSATAREDKLSCKAKLRLEVEAEEAFVDEAATHGEVEGRIFLHRQVVLSKQKLFWNIDYKLRT